MHPTMPPVALIVILVVLNLWALRAVSRYRAARRRPTASSPDRRQLHQPATVTAALATDSGDEPCAAHAPQASARAFPVHGLPPGPASAGVLEGLLRHVTGVTRAYVSPVTALAYVDYLPAQVTEEQLVGAIRGGGYRVGAAAQRFDWRQGHPG
jgi:hypothetical protein